MKVTINPLLACSCHNSPLIEARCTKFWQKTQNIIVKIHTVWKINWHWQVKYNFISKWCLFTSLMRLTIFMKRAKTQSIEVSYIPHGSACILIHICTPTRSRHGPWNILVVYIQWDHWSSVSCQLGDLHWILQAAIGFRQIINTSHDEALYTNNRRNNNSTASTNLFLFDNQHWGSQLSFICISAICSVVHTGYLVFSTS